jgi:hypothetical protein
MATFMETKFPISKEQRKQQRGKPPTNNHTLEDVAEEILNGILCQYEPPNIRSKNDFRTRYPSILRRSKAQRMKGGGRTTMNQSSKQQRVRWLDEQKDEGNEIHNLENSGNQKTSVARSVDRISSPESRGCSVAEACFDAGIEVGCVSTGANNHRKNAVVYDGFNEGSTTRPMMNAKEAIAVARAKSPRNYHLTNQNEGIVFDDDGNPTFMNSNKNEKKISPAIPIPLAPPPPNKRERFFPELCGVRINCGDEEAYLQVIPRSSFEKGVSDAIQRCSNTADEDEETMMEDDFDNSVIDYNEESDSGSDIENVPKHGNRSRSGRSKQLPQKALESESKNTKDVDNSEKKSMREVIDSYIEKDDDDIDADWEETLSSASPTKFLRRVWPRSNNNKNEMPSTNVASDSTSKDIRKPDDSDDDDNSQNRRKGIARRRVSSRSRSPSRRRGESKTSNGISNSVAVYDVYESVEIVNAEKKLAPKKTSIGAVLKSIATRSPRSLKKIVSSSSSLNEAANSDWDESIPIVPGLSAAEVDRVQTVKSDQTVSIIPQRGRSAEQLVDPYVQPTKSPIQSLPAENPIISQGDNLHVPTNHYPNAYLPQQQQSVLSYPPYPHIHPAHPLVNHGVTKGLDREDTLERQSFITAYRHGYDKSNQTSSMNDDAIERQSFIGAYRSGIEGNPISVTQANNSEPPTVNNEQTNHMGPPSIPPVYYHGVGPMTQDDAMERQSFITAYRQGLDPGPQPQPMSGPMSHDDILERMSYITAYRQGVDPTAIYSNDSGIKSFPPQLKRNRKNGRARSPYRRSHSFDPENQSGRELVQRNRTTNGAVNNGMGNYVLSQPIAAYNPTMMQTHQDPRMMHFLPPGLQNGYPVGDSTMAFYNAHPYSQSSYPMYASHAVSTHNAAASTAISASNHVPTQYVNMTSANPQGTGMLPTVDENNSSAGKEDQNADPELTWEERTRQAWERIRGGISALTFDAPSEEKADCETNKTTDIENAVATDTSNQSLSQLPSQVQETSNTIPFSSLQIQQQSILHPHELTKRVSFGEPQQMIYYDDQDENRSTMSLPAMATKKKMKFRGAKLVVGVFGKVKNSLNKVTNLSRSLSSDTHGTLNSGRSSYSTEWDGSANHSNYSAGPVHVPSQSMQSGPNYVHPSRHVNLPQNEQLPIHTNQGFLQPIQQYAYSNQHHVMQPIHPNQVPQQPTYLRQMGQGYQQQNSNVHNYPTPQDYTIHVRDGNNRRSL